MRADAIQASDDLQPHKHGNFAMLDLAHAH